MSLNVIVRSRGVKKVSFLGADRYNIQEHNKYNFFGKTNYNPIGEGMPDIKNLSNIAPEFMDTGVWTLGTSWTFALPGVLALNGVTVGITQLNVTVVGKTYKTRLVLGDHPTESFAGTAQVRLGTGLGTARSSPGVYDEVIVAAATTSAFIYGGTGGNIFTGKVISFATWEVIADQTCNVGDEDTLSIPSGIFADLDINRYDTISITAKSSDDTIAVVVMRSKTSLVYHCLKSGTATITLTGKDLFGKTDTITFDIVVA